MLIYEVNLFPQEEIAARFHAWLLEHITEMLGFAGFESASLYQITDPPPPPGCAGYCCQYQLRSRAALDRYLQDHAPAMRAEGVKHFGEAFTATRRVLESQPE